MIYVLYFLHVLVCVFLILVVLLQQGKGADLSVFGGGSTQTAFGARGAATLLHKLTVVSFVVFILTTLGIGVMKSGPRGSSVMSDVKEERSQPAPPAQPAQPAPAPPAEADAEAPPPQPGDSQ
ncbi:MAG TPA: preprotein translocase subunit SecG [Thermoanaerobaculia bacterium]